MSHQDTVPTWKAVKNTAEINLQGKKKEKKICKTVSSLG